LALYIQDDFLHDTGGERLAQLAVSVQLPLESPF